MRSPSSNAINAAKGLLMASLCHRCTGIFFYQGGGGGGGGGGKGGGEPFAQKFLASCPKFYEKVEKKGGSYTML